MEPRKQWILGAFILLAVVLLSTWGLKYAVDDGSRLRSATKTDTQTDASEKESKKPSPTAPTAENGTVILLDPGHGGVDPGKIGVHNEKEKDLNLSIACKIRTLLTQAGYRVFMTRDSDMGLYSETDSNKKIADLKNRCKMAEETNPALLVSIHQNSYSSAAIKGAQVFYFSGSENGKEAAELLQESLIRLADPQNTRQAKANDNYYLLKHCLCPAVIVECGFLSNEEEASKLSSEEYQDTLASAIVSGINAYCEKPEN